MNDIISETVAELRRLLAEAMEYEMPAVMRHKRIILADAAINALPTLLDAADLAVLLARVERRFPETVWHLEISRTVDAGWYVAVSDSMTDGYEVGTGDTLVAALRALLGEDT